MICHNKSVTQSKRYITLVFLLFAIAIRLAAPQTHILSAIERVEIFTQTCSALDPNCVQVSDHQIALEEDASHELNLMHHLLGYISQTQLHAIFSEPERIYIPSKSFWHWNLYTSNIYHPPRI